MPETENFDFGKRGCHLKGHLKRSRMAQVQLHSTFAIYMYTLMKQLTSVCKSSEMMRLSLLEKQCGMRVCLPSLTLADSAF